jgi:imidazolonepropionase-like amidohydrolase
VPSCSPQLAVVLNQFTACGRHFLAFSAVISCYLNEKSRLVISDGSSRDKDVSLRSETATPWFPPASIGDVAIAHVNVVLMGSPEILPDQTVVLRAGSIAVVGPAAAIPLDGAMVIDGTGKYLMPGLADMHVHYWDIGEFAMFLANGVTLVRNMWGSPFHLALRRRIDEGRFPGPRVVTTSPIIDGPGPDGTTIWPNSALAANPEAARNLVREFATRGYQETKAYSWLKPDVLRALGEASKQAGIRMVGHCPDGLTYEQAIDAGMTCFEHLTGIAEGRMDGRSLLGMRPGSIEAMKTVIENLKMDSVRRLAAMLAKRNIWNCPTLVVWQGMAQEETAAMSNALLAYELATLVAGWNPDNDFRFRNTTVNRSEWLTVAQARIEVYLRVIAILHEEGAPLLLGTDTPNPFVFQGFSIHDELRNLVRAGLDPYKALRAGTVDAARFLGEEDVWGTIAVGKRADLVLLSSNPLQDVTATRRPDMVFVNGYMFSRDDLDGMLEARKASVVFDASRVPSTLTEAARDTQTVNEGVLAEELAGVDAGRTRYRHARRADRGWAIEEVRSSSADGLHSWGGESRAQLELSPSLHVVRAELHGESFLGIETCKARLEGDAYVIDTREIDGFESSRRVPGPLYPSEDLAFTSILPLLSRGKVSDGKLAALGLEGSKPVVISLELSQSSDGAMSVHVDKEGTSADQSFEIDSDGNLTAMEEQTWRGLRRVTPAKND